MSSSMLVKHTCLMLKQSIVEINYPTFKVEVSTFYAASDIFSEKILIEIQLSLKNICQYIR